MYLFNSNTIPPAVEEGFEGPEKRLEVRFSLPAKSHSIDKSRQGLRNITKDQWQLMLNLVKCTIISSTSNQFLDSYVLSESSLFVYPNRIILKTCGTTTLLNCLDTLKEYGARCGASIQFVIFSRKNFNFPHKQQFPHQSFETEVDILHKYFSGSAHILGPVLSGGDHHFFYFASPLSTVDNADDNSLEENLSRNETDSSDSGSDGEYDLMMKDQCHCPSCLKENAPSSLTLEVLMSNLDVDVMKHFFRNSDFVDSKTTTKRIGLLDLLPEMTMDEIMFDPCGYSVNGINPKDGSYFTVHVTPESHCSFVSFETNMNLEVAARFGLIKKVVEMFRPGRFSVVITADHKTHSKQSALNGYTCKFKTQYEFEEGFRVAMFNYVSS